MQIQLESKANNNIYYVIKINFVAHFKIPFNHIAGNNYLKLDHRLQSKKY